MLETGFVYTTHATQSAQTEPSAPLPGGFARINGGTFAMGSPVKEPEPYDDETQDKVKVDKFYVGKIVAVTYTYPYTGEYKVRQVTVGDFYMGKHEVTQEEYQEVMGANPSYFKGNSLPVEQVSWSNAIEYCNRLSRKEGLLPAYIVSGKNVEWNRNANGYRLPTEAEWEYAFRAGATAPFCTEKTITGSQANHDGERLHNNKEKLQKKTMPVGTFAPNHWGLYDMHGSLLEWCWDRFRDSSSAQKNHRRTSIDKYRVARGVSWYRDARDLRCADKMGYMPSYQSYVIGFRLAHS